MPLQLMYIDVNEAWAQTPEIKSHENLLSLLRGKGRSKVNNSE